MRKRSTYIKPESNLKFVAREVLTFIVAILAIPVWVIFFILVMP